MTFDPKLLPPTLFYGSNRPDIRLRSRGGVHQFFCRNNRNLHLSSDDLVAGTYEAGALLEQFCREYCIPQRSNAMQPCPAFVANYKIGTENKGLAPVEMRPSPAWDECAGVQALLRMTETNEERFFLESYLDDRSGQDAAWRKEIANQWNEYWQYVENGWGPSSRRAKYDHLMWRTLRFPALIPQVWLNWLNAASDEDIKILDEYPSRVDFIAFWRGERHLIEIDGPSHYASFNEITRQYAVDERAYARNLKIARSLQRDGWNLTRIARVEIRDVVESEWAEFETYRFLEVLPFYDETHESHPTFTELGVNEIDTAQWVASNDLPF